MRIRRSSRSERVRDKQPRLFGAHRHRSKEAGNGSQNEGDLRDRSRVDCRFAGASRRRLFGRASPSAGCDPVSNQSGRGRARGKPIPARLIPPFATIKLFPPRYRISRGCFPHRPDKIAPIKPCRVGVAQSQKVIALLGDSHAFMWSPAILAMARRDGWAVVPLMRFGCTPEVVHAQRTRQVLQICRGWLRWATDRIRQLRPTVTLIGGSVETSTGQTNAAAAGMIEAARKVKPLSPVVVIGDPEGLSAKPVACLTASGASRSSCSTTWPPSSLAPYNRIAHATKSLGAGFLSTRGFVCYQRQCPAIVGHTIVWMDTNHLTGIYPARGRRAVSEGVSTSDAGLTGLASCTVSATPAAPRADYLFLHEDGADAGDAATAARTRRIEPSSQGSPAASDESSDRRWISRCAAEGSPTRTSTIRTPAESRIHGGERPARRCGYRRPTTAAAGPGGNERNHYDASDALSGATRDQLPSFATYNGSIPRISAAPRPLAGSAGGSSSRTRVARPSASSFIAVARPPRVGSRIQRSAGPRQAQFCRKRAERGGIALE